MHLVATSTTLSADGVIASQQNDRYGRTSPYRSAGGRELFGLLGRYFQLRSAVAYLYTQDFIFGGINLTKFYPIIAYDKISVRKMSLCRYSIPIK